MRRSSTLVLPVVVLLVLTFALLSACTELQEGADAGDATETTATTIAVAIEETTSESTESTAAPATTTTVAATTSTAAPTTTTTSGGSGGTFLQMNPDLLQTSPSIMQVDPNVFQQIDPNVLTAPTRVEDANPYLHYEGQWSTKLSSNSSGGTYRASSTTGSYVEIFFKGTGIRLIAPKGVSGGKVRIVLTGNGTSKVETVSLYNASASYQQTIWYSGPLANADYAVYFEHDSSNVGFKVIWVDALDVWGTITPP